MNSNSKEKRQKKNSFSFVSPAKVNLYFEVLQKRRDGYHDITSLFHTVNFGDILSFSFAENEHFTSNLACLKWDNTNLIYKALKLFRRRTGHPQLFAIHLTKNIPLQAGLGGGSSNAATTLWAVNKLVGSPLKRTDLQELSKEIGSDVPFFFSNGAAICEGRGEKVYPLPQKMELTFWVVKPDFGLCTKSVFSNFSLDHKMKSSSPFFNDLENAAFKTEPKLFSFYENLKRQTSQVVMTGSGSCFLVFQKEKPKGNFSFVKEVSTTIRKENHWYLL